MFKSSHCTQIIWGRDTHTAFYSLGYPRHTDTYAKALWMQGQDHDTFGSCWSQKYIVINYQKENLNQRPFLLKLLKAHKPNLKPVESIHHFCSCVKLYILYIINCMYIQCLYLNTLNTKVYRQMQTFL